MEHMMGWGVQEHGWRKGPWTAEEDKLLSEYLSSHGEGRWSSVARSAGLNRSGKSCRLRWVNYLKPGLKRGQLTPQEEGIIIELHALWGNRWSTIARYLPGRTDNEIKNYWRTHFKKKNEKSSQKQEIGRTKLLMPKQQQPPLQQEHRHQQQQQEDVESQGIQQKTAVFTYAAASDKDHQWWNVMHQETAACSWSAAIGDDALWDIGGLWTLDDDSHGHRNSSTSDCCKRGIQIQVDHTFSCGGVGDSTNSGGYFFK